MNEKEMICNCDFKADDIKKFEEHRDVCVTVGTDEWESKTTR